MHSHVGHTTASSKLCYLPPLTQCRAGLCQYKTLPTIHTSFYKIEFTQYIQLDLWFTLLTKMSADANSLLDSSLDGCSHFPKSHVSKIHDHEVDDAVPYHAGSFPVFHLTLHPMLGFHGFSTACPAKTRSKACRISFPVTGMSPPYLLGLESSHCP